MRNVMLFLLSVAACQPAESAVREDAVVVSETTEPRARGREGDTLLVFVHEVKPGRQQEYEALMTEIWGSALRKAAAGKAHWQHTMIATRDLVPLSAPSPESTKAYVYLIDPAPPNFFSDTTWSFPQDLLVDAGYSRAQADSLAKKLDGTLRKWDGYARVERNFSRR